MSLTHFQIGNFKAFGPKPQSIPLKPITLLFGPNSAGKSSAMHGALWLNELLQTGEIDVRHPAKSAGQIDLGGFAQMIHRRDGKSRLLVGASFDSSVLPNRRSGNWIIKDRLRLDLAYGALVADSESHLCLLSISIEVDDSPVLRFSASTQDTFRIDFFDIEHPALRPLRRRFDADESDWGKYGAEFYKEDADRGAWVLDILNRLLLRGGFHLDALNGVLPTGLSESPEIAKYLKELTPVERWLGMRKFYRHLIASIDCVLKACGQELVSKVAALEYIPPLRHLPDRFMDLSRAGDPWRRLITEPQVLTEINDWLGSKHLKSRYRLQVDEYVKREGIQNRLPEALFQHVLKVISKVDFSEELADAVEQARTDWESANHSDYLHTLPDYLESLIQGELDILQEWVENYAELDEEERRRRASNVVEDTIANEPFGDWAQPYYLKYLSEHKALESFLSQSWSIEESDLSAFTHVSGNAADMRRELSLKHLGHDTVVSLQDVGVGVSQVLPVLIHSKSSRNRWIAIEQPEIHIHPALQAELGDVFIESALGENKNTFLLETHSEHLILRLLRRIRETTRGRFNDWPESLKKACPNGIRPEDIAVLYVQPGEEGAVIRELRIDAQGKFLDSWPDGFFEESFNEMF